MPRIIKKMLSVGKIEEYEKTKEHHARILDVNVRKEETDEEKNTKKINK